MRFRYHAADYARHAIAAIIALPLPPCHYYFAAIIIIFFAIFSFLPLFITPLFRHAAIFITLSLACHFDIFAIISIIIFILIKLLMKNYCQKKNAISKSYCIYISLIISLPFYDFAFAHFAFISCHFAIFFHFRHFISLIFHFHFLDFHYCR